MKKLFPFFIILMAAFAALWLFIPVMSRAFLTPLCRAQAEKILQAPVTLGSAEIDFLDASVVLKSMTVFYPRSSHAPQKELFSIAKASLELHLMPLLLKDLAGIELKLERPKFLYVTLSDGSWELSNQIPLFRRGSGEKRLPVNIDALVIQDGEITYQDGTVHKTTQIEDLDLDVRKVRLPSAKEKLPSEFQLSATIEESGRFSMKGRADFLSPKTSFEADIELAKLPLVPFAPYYDKDLPIRIQNGNVGIASHAICEKDVLKAPAHIVIDHLEISPKGLKIFGMASEQVLDGLKDKNGEVALDMMIEGNIRNPRFHVLNDFTHAFVDGFSKGLVKGIGSTLEKVGTDVKSSLEKLKGLFKH